jgi:hypothetical protein
LHFCVFLSGVTSIHGNVSVVTYPGHVYVTDATTCRIRRITSAELVSDHLADGRHGQVCTVIRNIPAQNIHSVGIFQYTLLLKYSVSKDVPVQKKICSLQCKTFSQKEYFSTKYSVSNKCSSTNHDLHHRHHHHHHYYHHQLQHPSPQLLPSLPTITATIAATIITITTFTTTTSTTTTTTTTFTTTTLTTTTSSYHHTTSSYHHHFFYHPTTTATATSAITTTAITQGRCEATLGQLIRPAGCASYNPPLDELGLKATPAQGNIYFNYDYRYLKPEFSFTTEYFGLKKPVAEYFCTGIILIG